MKDQMETFMKGRTTITRRVETVKSLEFPTITICFDPATKLSVAKKYGFNAQDWDIIRGGTLFKTGTLFK